LGCSLRRAIAKPTHTGRFSVFNEADEEVNTKNPQLPPLVPSLLTINLGGRNDF